MANLLDTAKAAGTFNTLLQAINTAGLADTFNEIGPFTIFAPTDDAFKQLPAGTLDTLLKDKSQLTNLLTYHVVSGRYTAADLLDRSFLQTIQGQRLTISSAVYIVPLAEDLTTDAFGFIVNDTVTSAVLESIDIDDADIVQSDVQADNGIIQVINEVLMPKKDTTNKTTTNTSNAVTTK